MFIQVALFWTVYVRKFIMMAKCSCMEEIYQLKRENQLKQVSLNGTETAIQNFYLNDIFGEISSKLTIM